MVVNSFTTETPTSVFQNLDNFDEDGKEIRFVSRANRSNTIESLVGKLPRVRRYRTNGGLEELDERDAILRDLQNNIFEKFTGTFNPPETLKLSQAWFVLYVEARVNTIWDHTIVPVLNDGCTTQPSDTPMRTEINIKLYKVMLEIACLLQAEPFQTDASKSPSLLAILQHLRSEKINLVRRSDDILDERAIQMIFHICGWLLALWDPTATDSNGTLTVTTHGRRKRQNLLYTPSVERPEADLKKAAGVSMERLLDRFGKLLPLPCRFNRSDRDGGIEAGPQFINSRYLSYKGLLQALSLRVEWTRTLSQHLEYDERDKVLYLFCLPSLCRMLYRHNPETLLSNIYHIRAGEDRSLPQVGIETFLAEVLLSYRLLFGRDKSSRNLGTKTLAVLETRCAIDGIPLDPLLQRLCTKTCQDTEMQSLYHHLDAGIFEVPDFVRCDEYPFLGQKLLVLQNASMARQPYSIRRLWTDRRNPAQWFAIWAVLIIGGGTLIVQLAQLGFQIKSPFS